ncbi:MAG: AEC family transporter [Clostridia bacterium]
MDKFVYSLGLIVLGMILGQTLKAFTVKGIIKPSIQMEKYIKLLQDISLLGLVPVISMGAFWALKIDNMIFISLPFLGVAGFVIGGGSALTAARVLKLNKKQRGSMFVSGCFANLTSFGGLICYVFLGEISYGFVSMYKLFEEVFYYTIGFPIAKSFGDYDKEDTSAVSNLVRLLLDPYIIVSFLSISIGTSLNISGVARPELYKTINAVFIPLSSLLLVTSVGYNMKFSAVGNYLRECFIITVIKFVATPLLITTAAYLLGLGTIHDGLVLKVVMILSAMPPAFNSLIPPQIYNLDKDLANSSWLFNTGALAVVLPVLYFVQKSI